mmetsp:Transcript_26769/g.63738  ORF Transcript_26769/g.63738 Transcript_26769/m.63738 type:complete len:183 (-) Transcript_26769:53-601(-)
MNSEEQDGSSQLVAALRARLRQALAELQGCRRHLDASQLVQQQLSTDLQDHADVLGSSVETAAEPLAEIDLCKVPTSSFAMREAGQSQLKEELSMAKALLMLNNVSLSMDLDEGAPEASAEVVKLRGNPRLIQLLITLRQKVALLNQQYLLLRGDMLYLKHEMDVCKNWVQQSVRSALQSQF